MAHRSFSISRRDFLTQSMAATGLSVGAASLYPVVSAGQAVTGRTRDKIRMGFIGVGNRGTQLLTEFMANPDVEVVGLCDVYEPYVTRDRSRVPARHIESGRIPALRENFGSEVKQYRDFRQLLDAKDIDAVCIATPDHWHAVQTIMAIQAGKDVYVEKPLTKTIHEGRKMVQVQARSDRVVQVGLNRRGSSVYQKLASVIGGGDIGHVTVARAYRVSNMFPKGIGRLRPENPPEGLDWDMWLGPRAFRPYQYNIAPYYFRWWDDYSSQMGNWGVHYLDVIRWMIGEKAPVAVTAQGGKYVLKDDRTIPDTLDVTFEFACGTMAKFGVYEANGGAMLDQGEVEFLGTKGTLNADQNGYRITGSRPGQFQTWKTQMADEVHKVGGGSSFGDLGIKEDSTANLIRNFLDCVKSRKTPLCPLEEGHRSTSFAHLANMALAMGKRLEWDAEQERVTNCPEANDLLHYEYRQPWRLG